MAESNNTEKITMIISYARDPTGVDLSPYSDTPSWPQDMVINNCKPFKGENEKHEWTDGEHGQDGFNAAVNLETSSGDGSSGSYYCTIM